MKYSLSLNKLILLLMILYLTSKTESKNYNEMESYDPPKIAKSLTNNQNSASKAASNNYSDIIIKNSNTPTRLISNMNSNRNSNQIHPPNYRFSRPQINSNSRDSYKYSNNYTGPPQYRRLSNRVRAEPQYYPNSQTPGNQLIPNNFINTSAIRSNSPSCACARFISCPPCGRSIQQIDMSFCPCAAKPKCPICPPLSLIHDVAAKKANEDQRLAFRLRGTAVNIQRSLENVARIAGKVIQYEQQAKEAAQRMEEASLKAQFARNNMLKVYKT